MLDLFLELFLDFVLPLVLDLLCYRIFGPPDANGGRLAAIRFVLLLGLLGAVIGWLSLLVFPKPFLSMESIRIAILLIAPILSGILFGGWVLRRMKETAGGQLFAFGSGFLFVFGFLLVRTVGVM